jgi:signal transduction histidine kinase
LNGPSRDERSTRAFNDLIAGSDTRPIVGSVGRSDNLNVLAAATRTATRTACGAVEAASDDRRSSSGGALVHEIVVRAYTIADGAPSSRPSDLFEGCEANARRLAAGSPALAAAAALEFLAEAIVVATVAGGWPEGGARYAVARVAAYVGATERDAALTVYRRALATREVAQLPPDQAIELALALLVDLAPAGAVSLWSGANCLGAAGRGARSGRLREAAQAALEGVTLLAETCRTVVVDRWDEPFAALAARSLDDGVFLAEAAAALTPVLERSALYEQGVAREHRLVSAGERRLVRLSFDLHDGPLQELVAMAGDLRGARGHIEPLLDAPNRERARGCFDDLAARLELLDRELREIAHSVRSTTALDRPLQNALAREAEAARRAGIDVELTVGGDLSALTNSQKIVVYRVVQEALNNVRKHSEASSAQVVVRATQRFIQVVVTDDGRGIDAGSAAAASRLGLAGVCERVQLLGGAVTVDNAPSGGARVRATIPQWRSSTDEPETTYAATA